MTQNCLIVGASHAAAQLATSLRQGGWEGSVQIIGDEGRLPYQRPPLSKAFLSGEKDADSLAIRPAAFWEKQNVEFLSGHVSRIDRQAQSLTLDDGSQHRYDKLALCTGARVRRLPASCFEGGDTELEGVHYLRTMADVEGIQQQLGESKNAVIIGGGYIGLETAASLRKLGLEVTVLEAALRILQRVTAPEVSAFYQRLHAEEGVSIRTEAAVTAIAGQDVNGQRRVAKVVLDNGDEYPADMVIIGVGVTPNVELAVTAGLEVDNGIVINEHGQTSDANIVAVGDCANHYDARYQRRLRLESVPNAMEQAKSAAAMLCGQQKPYQALPWFWSDQYDLKLQIAGLSEGYDQVVIRGDANTGRSFAAFYFKAGELLAADCINRPQEFMLAKRLLTNQSPVEVEQLADESVDVKDLLAAATA